MQVFEAARRSAEDVNEEPRVPDELVPDLVYLEPGAPMVDRAGCPFNIPASQFMAGKYNFNRSGFRHILAIGDPRGGVWVGQFSPAAIESLHDAKFVQDPSMTVPLAQGDRPAAVCFHTVMKLNRVFQSL